MSKDIVRSDQTNVDIELQEDAYQVTEELETFEQENIDNKQASTTPLPDLNSDEYQAWWDSLDTSQRFAELWRQINLLDADQKIGWWKSMDAESACAWWNYLNDEQKVSWWQCLDAEQWEVQIRSGHLLNLFSVCFL